MRETLPEPICREGYGPGGAAVILTCPRGVEVAAERLRPIFEAHGGRLGATNSVGYLFRPVGRLRYARGGGIEARAAAAGAEDVLLSGDGVEVLTDPAEREHVRARLRRYGHAPAEETIGWRATQRVELSFAQRNRLQELERHLVEVDGVGHVYTNAQIPDERLAPL